MNSDRFEYRLVMGVALVAIAFALLFKLTAFGIWDPWELSAADLARDAFAGEVDWRQPPLAAYLVGIGLKGSGWLGRIPMALSGVAALAAAFFIAREYDGKRAALYALVVAATTPLFLFNSRQMFGLAPAFAASGWVGYTALRFALPRKGADKPERRWIAFAIACLIAVPAGGLLGAVLPPLLAIAVVAIATGRVRLSAETLKTPLGITTLAAFGALALCISEFAADRAEFNMLIGGMPQGGEPPTFEVNLERIFHSFAPWSGFALLALGRMLSAPRGLPLATDGVVAEEPLGDGPYREHEDDHDSEAEEALHVIHAYRLTLVLWASFGYVALTIFEARYGALTYLAVVPLACAIGSFFRDAERAKEGWWTAGIVGALFTALIIRDFALYPSGAIDGLTFHELEVPESFNPRIAWAATLGPFALVTASILGVTPNSELGAPTMKEPYQYLREVIRRGGAAKLWTIVALVIAAAIVLFGLICFVAGGKLGVPSIVTRVGKILTFIPFGIAGGVMLAQWFRFIIARLGEWRFVPVLVAGLAVGIYTAAGFQPALSAHFSPAEVYETYNALRADDDVLGEYRVGARAATYYAQGELREMANQPDLMNFLASETRQWVVFPADELPAINRAYRQRSGRHLFVADARSARVLLGTNQAVEGRENQNFIERSVLSEPPEMQNTVDASYEDKIELMGYDLELPNDGYVGAGQAFKVTWYWRCLRRAPGSYKIFLHVDGAGNRLNGDHDPVDGNYPVRLWDEGDIIVDTQELRVPANYRPGRYQFNIGFYAGSNRLEVVRGDKDDANRVHAGYLTIR